MLPVATILLKKFTICWNARRWFIKTTIK